MTHTSQREAPRLDRDSTLRRQTRRAFPFGNPFRGRHAPLPSSSLVVLRTLPHHPGIRGRLPVATAFWDLIRPAAMSEPSVEVRYLRTELSATLALRFVSHLCE